MVDVISSNCWLKPAILSMQLCQMVVQAQWSTDSPLLQLPYFTHELIQEFKHQGVEDIADFMNMEDEDRKKLLKFNDRQIKEIVMACNRYPSIRIEKRVINEETIRSGDNLAIEVLLFREGEENDYKDFVHAPYYPKVKFKF